MQRSEKVGTDETAALVRQMREALAARRAFDTEPECAINRKLFGDMDKAIAAADQWLAEHPVQKPVAWITYDEYSSGSYSPPYREKRLSWHKPAKNGTPLYAAPQVVAHPLTDEQILDCVRSVGCQVPSGLTMDRGPYEITEPSWFLTRLVRAIERAHRIG